MTLEKIEQYFMYLIYPIFVVVFIDNLQICKMFSNNR